uniref:Uncharacterized protein n=1 Tax=uncultured prokaryote TaxID=198431 RepID=A0A0H5Q447_9ZZZZ|nr:hypothetical protein [uncultured prokaryote]
MAELRRLLVCPPPAVEPTSRNSGLQDLLAGNIRVMLRVVTVLTGKPGSPWYSTLYFEGAISTEAQDAVDQVDVLWGNLTSVMVAGITATIEPFVASIDPATGDVIGGFVTTPAAPQVGDATGSMLPGASQVQQNLLTGVYVGGRNIRGKMYIPGLPASYSDLSGRVDATVPATMAIAFDALLADGPDLVVWSRKNGATYAVSDTTTSPNFASLRSRRD